MSVDASSLIAMGQVLLEFSIADLVLSYRELAIFKWVSISI